MAEDRPPLAATRSGTVRSGRIEGGRGAFAAVAPRSANSGRVSIPAGEGPQRYDLRVGESVDRGSGEVRDIIGEGEIKIGPRRAAPAKK